MSTFIPLAAFIQFAISTELDQSIHLYSLDRLGTVDCSASCVYPDFLEIDIVQRKMDVLYKVNKYSVNEISIHAIYTLGFQWF